MATETMTKDFLSGEITKLQEKVNEAIGNKNDALKAEFETKLDDIKSELDVSEKLDEIKSQIEAEKERINKLAEKKKVSEKVLKSFNSSFAENLKKNYEDFKEVATKGGAKSMFLEKATVNDNNSITGGLANESGGAIVNQLNQGVILPSQLVNFDDLVTTVAGSEDTLTYWREQASANNIGGEDETTGLKPELVFDFDPVNETAAYTAGIYRFHKRMFRNLPWLQQRLPQMMRRDFYKKQNADYYSKLVTAATAYSGSGSDIDAIVEAIGQLESDDYPVNGVVLNPADWARLSITKDTSNGYTLPSTVNFSNGQLTINGVPVFKATWVDADTALVGDWTQSYKYVTDGLKINFSEEDSDNFQKNAITSRVEESNVLVIEQPASFVNIPNLDGSV